jgi:predicted transglutaminase-like cysteine proteinase
LLAEPEAARIATVDDARGRQVQIQRGAIFTLLAAVILFCGTGELFASSIGAANPVAANEYGQTPAPIGHIAYCKRNPGECIGENAPIGRIDLTAARQATLIEVNSAVNAEIIPVTDNDLYGETEYWTMPTDAGDCEDVLLLKRRTLHSLGFPMQSLRITVVLDEAGEGHAVLTVTTRQGDYVLDNRRNEILLWRDTGYKFLKRQSARDPKLWVSLVKNEMTVRRLLQVGSDR